MTAAIFGLLGVIVGGVLNGVVAYWLEYRREGVALKAAARLLGNELTVALARVNYALGTENTRRLAEIDVSFPEWNEHRLTLARRMETSGWFSTALAIRDAQRAALLGQQEPRPLTDEETNQLLFAKEELGKALGRITPLARGIHLALPLFRRRREPDAA